MSKTRIKKGMTRRTFLKASAAATGAAAIAGKFGKEFVTTREAEAAIAHAAKRRMFYAACPYCGVGCGTVVAVEGDKIVGIVPRKDHPTNKGLQCIKGLTADEPLNVDRFPSKYADRPVWIRKDMSDPLKGRVSRTKGAGGFDEKLFYRVSWEEGLDFVADKITAIVKKFGPNQFAIWSSGQHFIESLYLENKLTKGIIGSTTIEGSPRMCMTSAVTGYFATQGSDLSAGSYRDVDDADFITHWGHNPREGHPVLFWRIADAKHRRNIPTLVVDPRRTPTVKGYEQINKANAYHFPTVNGDLALHNSLAYAILSKHEQAVDYKFLEEHATGWKEYIAGVKKDYNYRDNDVRKRRGIDIEPSLIEKIAEIWADASLKGRKRGRGGVISFWGIGYNQHLHGQHNTIGIYNLHALTGNTGRPGAAAFSMTGQPNAVGRRMMGGLTARLPFNQGLNNVSHRNDIADLWGVSRKRLAAVAEQKNVGLGIGVFERAHPDRASTGAKDTIQCIYCTCGTHIDPADTNTLVRPALTRAFVVSQELYMHAPNNYYADVVLPGTSWGEASGTFANSERRININSKCIEPLPGYMPDLDIYIELGKRLCDRLGLDKSRMLPYRKRADGWYDSEEVFREIIRGSTFPGSDIHIGGLLEVEKKDGISPYRQLAELGGIQWPAPTYKVAKAGGLKYRFRGQEDKYWPDKKKHYRDYRTKDGYLHVRLVHNDYTRRREITEQMANAGVTKGWFFIDHMDVLKAARDNGLTPEIPDAEYLGRKWDEVPDDKFPFWFNSGIVYEHFHTAKTIRSATSRKLVPEQYLEIHPDDARDLGIKDGDLVKVVAKRIDPETGKLVEVFCRASVGDNSKVKPARNSVPRGMVFQPWNLQVADNPDPDQSKNRWMTNRLTHRAFDPVSGQVDYKKGVCRVEKV